jgi:hypothetical protein
MRVFILLLSLAAISAAAASRSVWDGVYSKAPGPHSNGANPEETSGMVVMKSEIRWTVLWEHLR